MMSDKVTVTMSKEAKTYLLDRAQEWFAPQADEIVAALRNAQPAQASAPATNTYALTASLEELVALWEAVEKIDKAMSDPLYAHLDGYQKFEGGKVFLANTRARGVIKPERQPTAHAALIALAKEVDGE